MSLVLITIEKESKTTSGSSLAGVQCGARRHVGIMLELCFVPGLSLCQHAGPLMAFWNKKKH